MNPKPYCKVNSLLYKVENPKVMSPTNKRLIHASSTIYLAEALDVLEVEGDQPRESHG